MDIKILGSSGIVNLWNYLKSKFVMLEAGKSLSSNDFTDADKRKLDGLTSCNISAGTKDYTAGVTPLADGEIYIVYE